MRNIIYYQSVYNILGYPEQIVVQLILWCFISVFILVFNLYLRYYSLRMYEKINNKNITDADYSIILRRLPDDTTQQDIRDLFKNSIEFSTVENTSKFYNLLKIEQIHIIYSLKETNEDLETRIK